MKKQSGFSRIVLNSLGDIRFWIIVFFVLRFYGITDAPLENGHNWRQSLTNMIARNFLQVDPSILYPRIDYDGNNSGIIGSEFPFFNYLIYLFYKIFGFAHWYGRLINLVVSSFGIWFFYRLLKRFFDEKLAFTASMIFLTSIWFAFSRKSMPDTFCISLVIISVFYACRYLYDNRRSALLLFFFFASLAVLCKIPALYFLSILCVPLFDSKVAFRSKVMVSIAGAMVLVLVYLWYFYWVPYLLAKYHFQLYFPKEFMEGIRELSLYVPETCERFYFSAMQSFLAFCSFVFGLFILIRKAERTKLLLIGITSLFFAAFIIKTGAVFPLHNYYVVPFVPVMVFVAAHGILAIKTAWLRIAVLALIMIEGVLNQQHDFRIKDKEYCKLKMESIAEGFSDRQDLFLVNGGQSPQAMYFLNRRGWSMNSGDIDLSLTDSLHVLGCRYLFINMNEGTLDEEFKSKEVIYRDNDFIVYSL
jgi:hypothetical protein